MTAGGASLRFAEEAIVEAAKVFGALRRFRRIRNGRGGHEHCLP
jgi:hypothetical protein